MGIEHVRGRGEKGNVEEPRVGGLEEGGGT